jgi:hypothetical protein
MGQRTGSNCVSHKMEISTFSTCCQCTALQVASIPRCSDKSPRLLSNLVFYTMTNHHGL